MYEPEDKVWFKRPAGLTAGLVSVWEGPGTVVRRIGRGLYGVSTSGGDEQAVNDDQMKEYAVDRYAEGHVPLYYWRGGRYDNQVTLGEGEVERISAHKERMDGVLLLLTKWKGQGRSTWEPIRRFVHRYAPEMVRYMKGHGLEGRLGECF